MVNFPSSLDTDNTLFVAVNNKRTQLTAPIDNSTLTIPVADTTGFPPVGYITILTGTDPVDAEAIYYTSLSPTQFNAATRGAGSTSALAHNSGDNVDLTVVAAHHNELKDAVIQLEYFVGVSGSENFLRINNVGNVYIPGELTVTGSATTGRVVATSGSFSQSLTVSGVPVITGASSVLVSGTAILGEPEFRAIGDIVLHTAGNIITWSGYGVRRTGDQMSGTLDMQSNRVRNAGVAEVQTTAPATPAEGMVWYNTTSGTTYIRASSNWSKIQRYPYSTSAIFTTASVANSGGTLSVDQTFVDRALITKLTISPVNPAADSTIIEFYMRDTYLAPDLEYKATTSGSFTDNDVWYHRDKDSTAELHLKLTNNSLTSTAFDVTIDAEAFA